MSSQQVHCVGVILEEADTFQQKDTCEDQPGTLFFHLAVMARLFAGMRVLDNEYKLRQNIKIAMLYLEDDDAVNAEAFIKKAASLITSSKVAGSGRQQAAM